MSISSDEINYLIYRYLQENGFTHTAFSFAYESLVTKSSVSQIEIPPGALITFLQKGLEYVGIEEHINEDGSIREFERDYSLLSPFVYEAVALKEDRKLRKISSASLRDDVNASEAGAVDDGTLDGNVKEETVPPSTILLRNDTTSKSMQLCGHQSEVFMCVWNPHHLQLASGSADGVCRLWGLWDTAQPMQQLVNSGTAVAPLLQEQGQPIRTTVLPHTKFVGERCKDVTSVTWSPDGQFLATGCYDGLARIWDNRGNLKLTLQKHTGPVFSLKWNKAGNFILSGSYDKSAIVWDASTGAVLKQFSLHAAPVLDVDWRDSDMFVTCSSDKIINVCSMSSPESSALYTFEGHQDEVNAICWSPCGKLIASCSDDTTAKIWTLEPIEKMETDSKPASNYLKLDLKGHTKEIYTTRWTPTGPGSANTSKPLWLCTASFDGTVKIWSSENGDLVHTLRRQPQPVYSISPSPTGEFIATGSLGGFVSIFSLIDGSLIREIKGNGDTFDVSWSYDGSLMSCCFSSGVLHVFDARQV